MTFALANGVITQSGTDADFSGLAGVAGVNVQQSGAVRSYFVGDVGVEITGTCTLDPAVDCLVSNHGNRGLGLQSGCVFNFGKQTTVNGYTYNSDGTGYINSDTPNAWYGAYIAGDLALRVDGGATLNWYGGTMAMPHNGFRFHAGAAIAIYDGALISGTGNADPGRQIISIIDCPVSGNGFKMVAGELYPLSGFASSTITGITRQAASLAFDPNAVDTSLPPLRLLDIDVGGKGNDIDVAIHTQDGNEPVARATVVNSATGTNLAMFGAETSANERNKGYVAIRKSARFTVSNIASAPVVGAAVWVRDKNNAARKNLNGTDDTADKTYVWQTDTGGASAPQEVVTGIVNAAGSNARGQANAGPYTIDLRGKTNVPGADTFDVSAASYLGLLQTQEFSFAGIGTLTGKFTLLTDAAVASISEAQAGALTTIATLDQLYAAAKFWKTRPVLARLEYPTSTTQPATAAGTSLNLGALNLVVDAVATAAFALDTATNTITIKSTTLMSGALFTSLATTGNVTFANGASPAFLRDLTAILNDIKGKTDALPADPASAASVASPADIWAHLLASDRSAADLLKIIAAVAAGKTLIETTTIGEATVTYRSIDDTHVAISGQMTGSERTSVTLTP